MSFDLSSLLSTASGLSFAASGSGAAGQGASQEAGASAGSFAQILAALGGAKATSVPLEDITATPVRMSDKAVPETAPDNTNVKAAMVSSSPTKPLSQASLLTVAIQGAAQIDTPIVAASLMPATQIPVSQAVPHKAETSQAQTSPGEAPAANPLNQAPLLTAAIQGAVSVDAPIMAASLMPATQIPMRQAVLDKAETAQGEGSQGEAAPIKTEPVKTEPATLRSADQTLVKSGLGSSPVPVSPPAAAQILNVPQDQTASSDHSVTSEKPVKSAKKAEAQTDGAWLATPLASDSGVSLSQSADIVTAASLMVQAPVNITDQTAPQNAQPAPQQTIPQKSAPAMLPTPSAPTMPDVQTPEANTPSQPLPVSETTKPLVAVTQPVLTQPSATDSKPSEMMLPAALTAQVLPAQARGATAQTAAKSSANPSDGIRSVAAHVASSANTVPVPVPPLGQATPAERTTPTIGRPLVAGSGSETATTTQNTPEQPAVTSGAFSLTAPSQNAATTYTAAATPSQASSLMSQSAIDNLNALSVQINKRAGEGKTTFNMELQPANLGRVDVTLNISKDGQLTAHLAFDSEVTATSFSAHESNLRQELIRMGLVLADDALTFSSRLKPEVAAQIHTASAPPASSQVTPGAEARSQDNPQQGSMSQGGSGQNPQQQNPGFMNHQQSGHRPTPEQVARHLAHADQLAAEADLDMALNSALNSGLSGQAYRSSHASLALNLIV
ncbi:MAG: flagellar hook-length control protein FliK [Asticcacaulis sp.]